jgi:hypothetical protein
LVNMRIRTASTVEVITRECMRIRYSSFCQLMALGAV